MKNSSTIARQAGAILLAMAAFSASAVAQPRTAPEAPQIIVNARANCYAVGQRVAAQYGGTLMGASAVQRGGQTLCRIVVSGPGRNGQRPRRVEVVVPAG